MCADTESKERLGEVVKSKVDNPVSSFKKFSSTNFCSHITPPIIGTNWYTMQAT